MTLRVGSIVVNVRDVARAMAFWGAALDYQAREAPDPDWVVLRPRAGGGPNLSLNLSASWPEAFPHLHLDLYTEDQAGEVDRLVELGARRVEDWPYPVGEHDFVVLEDPDGNRFCVIDTSGD